eukprot:365142-Chlamydomonas_euryale.AAC.12
MSAVHRLMPSPPATCSEGETAGGGGGEDCDEGRTSESYSTTMSAVHGLMPSPRSSVEVAIQGRHAGVVVWDGCAQVSNAGRAQVGWAPLRWHSYAGTSMLAWHSLAGPPSKL